MKILLANDKFKGSFDAEEVAVLLSKGIRQTAPKATIVSKPAFDGGEGTADAISGLISMQTRTVQAENISGQTINASIHWLGERRLAMIESAQVLRSDLPWKRPDFLRSSSWALGKLIAHALELRPLEIWITCGGTLTSDGGWGAASFFGLDTKSEDGTLLEPCIQNLNHIRRSTLRHEHSVLQKTKLHLICDVNAPMLSPGGTSFRSFLVQKGALESDEDNIMHGIENFVAVLKSDGFETLAPEAPYTGSAGGIALGLSAVAPQIQCSSGCETYFRISAMRAAISDADWVVCGEGFLDESSLYGKSAFSVAKMSHDLHKPVVGVFGGAQDPRLFEALGLKNYYLLNPHVPNMSEKTGELQLHDGSRAEWLKACRSKLIEIGRKIGQTMIKSEFSQPSAG